MAEILWAEKVATCAFQGHPIKLTVIGETAHCPCGLCTIMWEMPDDIGRLGVQTIVRPWLRYPDDHAPEALVDG